MRKLLYICLASVALLQGCATWSTSSVENKDGAPTPTQNGPAKIASEVKITEGDITDRKYQSLGDLTVQVNKTTIFHPSPTREMVVKELQVKAAELGADAVIFVRYGDVGVSFVSWGSLEGKGRAIKFVE